MSSRRPDTWEGWGGEDEARESLKELRKKYAKAREVSEPTLMEEFDMLEQKKKLLYRLKRGEKVGDAERTQVAIAAAAAKVIKEAPKRKVAGEGVQLSPERGGGGGGGGDRGGSKLHWDGRERQNDDEEPEARVVRKEVSWEGYGLESVWKGEHAKPVQTIWGKVMHRSHDIAVQERQRAAKKLEIEVARQAKTVTAIADLDLSRSRIMAKLHRDTDPLKKGTAALLKLSPSILKSINSNLQDKKKHKGGHATSAPVQVSLGQAHQRLLSPIEDDEEERRKKRVDLDSLVTPRRNVRRWERELVDLVRNGKKRREFAEGAKTDRRMKAFKPLSKEEMKRYSLEVAHDFGYLSDEQVERELEKMDQNKSRGKRRNSMKRRGSSSLIEIPSVEVEQLDPKADQKEKKKLHADLFQRQEGNKEEAKMCRDFQVSVNSVRAVNSSLHDVTHKYTFKYIKLGTMIAKGGRDDAFQEVGCDLGLFDRPMLRDLQNMQAALEQSGKSIRKLRVDGDSAVTSFLPPKVFLHPPFAPDIVEANKHSVEESSLKNRIPKMLLQCTEKTTNELCAVQRKAHKELERLKAVEAGLLRRDARIVEAAIETQMKAVEKMGHRWLTALVLGLAARLWIGKAFKVIHHRKVVQPKAATAIQKRWRDWHRKKTDMQIKVMNLIICQVVRRRRVKTRNLSAEIIKTMLKETAFLSNVNRAIRRFRLYVIMVQRHVKGWLECCRAENKMMLRQVERVEKAELLAAVKAKRLALRQEREDFEKAQQNEFVSSASRPADLFEGSEPFQVVQWPQLQVPTEVRQRILQAAAVRRRKQYVLDLHAYDAERQRFKMVRQQFIMFTARVHQFAQDVKGTDDHKEADLVSEIVLHELDKLSHREDGSGKGAVMAREQAELLKKLHIPDRPKYPQFFEDADALALARQGMEESGSTLLVTLTAWYRNQHESHEKKEGAKRAALVMVGGVGAWQGRGRSPTGRNSPHGRNRLSVRAGSPQGRVTTSPTGRKIRPKEGSPLARPKEGSPLAKTRDASPIASRHL